MWRRLAQDYQIRHIQPASLVCMPVCFLAQQMAVLYDAKAFLLAVGSHEAQLAPCYSSAIANISVLACCVRAYCTCPAECMTALGCIMHACAWRRVSCYMQASEGARTYAAAGPPSASPRISSRRKHPVSHSSHPPQVCPGLMRHPPARADTLAASRSLHHTSVMLMNCCPSCGMHAGFALQPVHHQLYCAYL